MVVVVMMVIDGGIPQVEKDTRIREIEKDRERGGECVCVCVCVIEKGKSKGKTYKGQEKKSKG